LKRNKTFIKDSLKKIRNQKKKDQNINTKNKKKTNMQFFWEHKEKKRKGEKKNP
jgi:hypothetical protein